MSHSHREAVSLEGYLQCRMGKSSGQSSLLWRRRFVYFSFADGGSLTVYKESPNFNSVKSEMTESSQSTSVLRSVYKKFARSSNSDLVGIPSGLEIVDFDITSDLPWIAKDVERDSSSFVVEISTFRERPVSEGEESVTSTLGKTSVTGIEVSLDDDLDVSDDEVSVRSEQVRTRVDFTSAEDFDLEDDDNDEDDNLESCSLDGKNGYEYRYHLGRELATARRKGKPLRIYFRCEKGSIEKALWLRAFATFGRLSSEQRRQRGIIHSLTTPLHIGSSKARIRSIENSLLARDTRHLDLTDREDDPTDDDIRDIERIALGHHVNLNKDREYRVSPSYAYRYRWMTRAEMREEMLLTSERFHDLRQPGCTKKEIGSLKVEVLQCLGLPKFDRACDTNAVVYLVCGEYSFVTDVIPNRRNPMWLRKSRRACYIPLFHGYACLYVGVFSDESKKTKDEFAGRVEIHLSRLRPGSVYDVTIPLRLSKHVYSRRKRGAIRLRFSLNWSSERDALLSYIPPKIRIPLPQNTLPNYSTTVRCTDPKAFRNIAITVHGAHLPGRFTFEKMRAAIREINYTRKYIFTVMRQYIRDLRHWQSPSISAYVFFSWMHCVFSNQFSLVPAYVVLFFFMVLMCNYIRYCTDEPSQFGFIPPSWEEMFMALVIGGSDKGTRCIEPLEHVPRKGFIKPRKSPSSNIEKTCEYKVSTYKPKGKGIMKSLGLIPAKPRSAEEEHLEFCFANGIEYPKFRVKDSLIPRKVDSLDAESSSEPRIRAGSLDSNSNPLARFCDVDINSMMKRDCSGTKEFDEEEMNFNPTSVVFATGKKAKSKIFKTATALGDSLTVSQLNYVSGGLQSTKNILGNSIGGTGRLASFRQGLNKMESMRGEPNSMIQSSVDQRSDSDDDYFGDDFMDSSNPNEQSQELNQSINGDLRNSSEEVDSKVEDDTDPALVFPQQDIDVEGPKNGKLLTDDLAEIKDKMHELTWHLFDDQTYVIKNANTVFFGDMKKPEKRRSADVKKQMDKSLGVGQYSYTNPFVSRVGSYVEPIIGSAYSFLCLFRAGFNLLTWRDPMMTFWVSLFCGLLAIVLFIFPWRQFLFIIGLAFVGPQNWAIRLLREKGRLQAAPVYKSMEKKLHLFTDDITEVPIDAPVFTTADRLPGNEKRYPRTVTDDPREIHHVVVPYSPLVYGRCYDWPPEPQYAQVKREQTSERHLKKEQHISSTASRMSSESDSGIRRRRSSLGQDSTHSRHSRKSTIDKGQPSPVATRHVQSRLEDIKQGCDSPIRLKKL